MQISVKTKDLELITSTLSDKLNKLEVSLKELEDVKYGFELEEERTELAKEIENTNNLYNRLSNMLEKELN